MKKYSHFMCDLETRGNSPGCHILSIGLIAFDPFSKTLEGVLLDDGLYIVVSRESCDEAMLHIDDETMAWWRSQSPEARTVLSQSEASNATPLDEALLETIGYVAGHCSPRNALIWGNGADFDNPILSVAARMIGQKLPWQWGNRCYRTVKNLHELIGGEKAVPISRIHGTHHNALDDARNQAVHLWDLTSTLRDRLA